MEYTTKSASTNDPQFQRVIELIEEGHSFAAIETRMPIKAARAHYLMKPSAKSEREAMRKAKCRCQKCGRTGRLIVHHKIYSATPELEMLCGKCHSDAHNKFKENGEYGGLTEREFQTLKLLCEGHTALGISVILKISQKTVEKHKQHLFRTLDVNCNVSAVLKGIKLGIIKV